MKYYILVLRKWYAFLRIFISCQIFFPWLIKRVCEAEKEETTTDEKGEGEQTNNEKKYKELGSQPINNKKQAHSNKVNENNSTTNEKINQLTKTRLEN